MKIRKSAMKKVIAPNQKNAQKPTEPKPAASKRRVPIDAIKLDLFSEEILIGQEDRPKFEALRDSLAQEYPPTTPLRQIGFDLILRFTWEGKLELRKQETSHKATDVQTAGGGGATIMEHWYAADHRALQNGLRFLRHLRAIVADSGLLQLEQEGPLKESLITGWGANFYDRLMECKGMNPRTIRLAEHLEHMITNFRMKPPLGLLGECAEDWVATRETPGLTYSPTDPRPGAAQDLDRPRVIPDPKLQQQMAVKLIDAEIEHLETLVRIRRQGSGETAQTQAECSHRSFAEISRDLQGAIELFLKIEKQGL
jgi:hypothetical protein